LWSSAHSRTFVFAVRWVCLVFNLYVWPMISFSNLIDGIEHPLLIRWILISIACFDNVWCQSRDVQYWTISKWPKTSLNRLTIQLSKAGQSILWICQWMFWQYRTSLSHPIDAHLLTAHMGNFSACLASSSIRFANARCCLMPW
jgi:hypothetical protein